MSNRIVATAAASALAAYASIAAAIVAFPSAVAAEPVTAAAPSDGSVWGKGSVGAMHFEVGSVAFNEDQVLKQSRGLVTVVPAIFVPTPSEPRS